MADEIDSFFRGFVVSADDYFGQQSERDELDSDDYEEDGEEKQRTAADSLHQDEAHIGQPKEQYSSNGPADEPKNAEYLERTGGIAQKEFYGQQVQDDFGQP